VISLTALPHEIEQFGPRLRCSLPQFGHVFNLYTPGIKRVDYCLMRVNIFFDRFQPISEHFLDEYFLALLRMFHRYNTQ
jgi:hypothetical protein